MPTVHFRGQQIECAEGECLKDVLDRHGAPPHNGLTRWINCHGIGSCGSCTVEVRGDVADPSLLERLRLMLPPFWGNPRLRLACKTRVQGDVEVTKHGGILGHKLD